MKVLKELELKIGTEKKTIYFGIPDNQEEIEGMHKLRYEVYARKDYIEKERFKDGKEADEYDEEGKSKYFVAKIDNRILGAVRLIQDDYLPTEKDFEFSESEEMRKIPRQKRGEVGRLVVTRYSDTVYLPRNLVMLFLMDCLVTYGNENDILGGYSFVKTSLINKLKKLKTPVHLITKYKQVYPTDGILYKYFNQQHDPVVPVFFLTQEISKFLDDIINKGRMFEKISEGKLILKENFYNKFLRFLKII